MHGLNIDELLICSSPQHMDHEPAGRPITKTSLGRVPSVSLAAADIRIQYRIDHLLDWARSSATPEDLLRKIAETHVSRLIYRYDIDALFTESRLTLVDEIRSAIEADGEKSRLGVKIIHVAITAAHPPVDVAGDFEATVVALQERETRIQQARQSAIQVQVEATGSAETFARLSALADRVDRQRGENMTDNEGLLQDGGGEVSQILAEARSYRFTRENRERGTTERFAAQLRAYNASPQNYRYDTYLAILEKGLASNRKVVLLGNEDQTIVRMGVGEGAAVNQVPEILVDR
jgi:regulator of protease activity HflC (stomatin/prohibitin superfamily)